MNSRGIDACPPWFAPVIDNPLRRWLHKPEEILGRLIAPGFTVVELGCGSDPFTIALARMVGVTGRVFVTLLWSSSFVLGCRRCRADRSRRTAKSLSNERHQIQPRHTPG